MWIILPVAILELGLLLGEREAGSVEDLLDERVHRSIVDDEFGRRSVALPLPALHVASVLESSHRLHPHRGDCHRPHGEAISNVREGEAIPLDALHDTTSKVVRMRPRHCFAKS